MLDIDLYGLLPIKVVNVLADHDIKTVKDLADLEEGRMEWMKVLTLPGMGRRGYALIVALLEKHGFKTILSSLELEVIKNRNNTTFYTRYFAAFNRQRCGACDKKNMAVDSTNHHYTIMVCLDCHNKQRIYRFSSESDGK